MGVAAVDGLIAGSGDAEEAFAVVCATAGFAVCVVEGAAVVVCLAIGFVVVVATGSAAVSGADAVWGSRTMGRFTLTIVPSGFRTFMILYVAAVPSPAATPVDFVAPIPFIVPTGLLRSLTGMIETWTSFVSAMTT
jgi:hypothetical protein